MPTDDSPLKPPENDQSQQTLDTRTPSPTPGISFVETSSDKPPQPAPRQSAFSPGDTVAKRFRILRFIAHGGMGEVYEALDIELKQKVALKTVRFGLLVDATALERFRQEIVVAKRVTHPNVCRTYDLFRHEATKEGESDVLVVSMELLAGQNLDQFLKEKGKLSTAEALPLVEQMVAGLAAAHEAGVVHRDFKTNNVMLVPPMSGSGPMRAVVSDFGLAHSLDVGEFALTRTGEMLGTPAFMAPEQVTGKEITPATDVYALGVVMFEMVTGRLPFAGKNWRETAFTRLEQPPPSAKSLQPDLDSLWDLTILKCMQIVPADRYATVTEVERALVGEIETVIPEPRRKLKRLLAVATGLVLVAGLGIFIGIRFPGLLQRGAARSVAVLGFKNNSGDRNLDRWGNEFRANLGGTLDVNPIHLVSHREMGNSWKLQAPSEMDEEPSSETLAQLQHHGCRYAVYGEYSVAGTAPNRDIRWNIHLVDTETGKGVGTIPVSLKETELTDVIPNTGEKVRGLLGVSLSEPEKLAVKNGLPANDE